MLLYGSRICGLDVFRIIGWLNDGLSVLNLFIGKLVSLVVSVILILCEVVMVMKYGWFGILGSVML